MAHDREEAARLAREEAERVERSREDLARSKFARPVAEQQEPARAEERAPVPPIEGPELLPNKAVAYEEHRRADAERFDRRRQDARDSYAELRQAEIEKTVGGIEDPDMQAENTRLIEEINQKWAEKEAARIALINREELDRLNRTRDLYGRDD